MNIFIVSDTHFHHSNIIKFCNRPYADADEMDEALIENWNKVVKPQDKVYHLGDVYFKQKNKNTDFGILSRLNGTKNLVVGNHDELKDPVLHKHFSKMYMWRFLPNEQLLLTHVPVHPNTLLEKPKYADIINVHGHIHDMASPKGRLSEPRKNKPFLTSPRSAAAS